MTPVRPWNETIQLQTYNIHNVTLDKQWTPTTYSYYYSNKGIHYKQWTPTTYSYYYSNKGIHYKQWTPTTYSYYYSNKGIHYKQLTPTTYMMMMMMMMITMILEDWGSSLCNTRRVVRLNHSQFGRKANRYIGSIDGKGLWPVVRSSLWNERLACVRRPQVLLSGQTSILVYTVEIRWCEIMQTLSSLSSAVR